MLDLPFITLVCVDCVDVGRAIEALDYSQLGCTYGAIKLLTSIDCDYKHRVRIPAIRSIEAYSEFMVRELWKYVDTHYCLVVQHDGWVCNPGRWTNDWLQYDYVGGNVSWTEPGPDGKGANGGFSLRSANLLRAGASIISARSHPEDAVYSSNLPGCYDFWGCLNGQRAKLEAYGMRFAPRTAQASFAPEGIVWNGEFGHHVRDLRHWAPAAGRTWPWQLSLSLMQPVDRPVR